ncbi:MAG: hypothetical protein AAF601_07950 [Pseudomonadota bacterium]
MSDPMTNAEVEDVLSSIRRLVSDGKAPDPALQTSSSRDRLVLTPALRVSDASDVDMPETDDTEAETSDEMMTFVHRQTPDNVPIEPAPFTDGLDEDRMEDAQETFGSVQEPWDDAAADASIEEGDRAADVDVGAPVTQNDKAAALQLPPEAGADDASSVWQNDAQDPSDVAPHDEPTEQNVSDALASDVSPAAPDEDELVFGALNEGEVETPERDDIALSPETEDDTVSDATDMLEDTSFDDPTADDADTPFEDLSDALEGVSATASVSLDDASLSAKVAALESLLADQAGEWEPDSPPSVVADAEALEWETPASEVHDTPEQTISEPPDAAGLTWQDATVDEDDDAPESDADTADREVLGAQDSALPEDILDEEALRELIADIVRQELQGALGERITRNVRKLVRREIHRALAAHELE